jgi:aspartate/tyrosine/aromatic aminotransferase
VTSDPKSAGAVMSVLENIVRPIYSNPPAHGARIVAHVLNSAELTAVSDAFGFFWVRAWHSWGARMRCCMQEWKTELSQGMARVRRMRTLLRDALVARGTPGSWDHITQQIGMFSYTGLTEAQSRAMVDLHHVYMLQSGRINVAGLNEATVAIAADAIHAVITAPAL